MSERQRRTEAGTRAAQPMTKERVEAAARACERSASRMSRTELERWHRANVGFRVAEDEPRCRTQAIRARVAASMFYKKMPAGVDTPWAEEAEREMTDRIRAAAARGAAAAAAAAPTMSAAQVAAWGAGAAPKKGRRTPAAARRRRGRGPTEAEARRQT